MDVFVIKRNKIEVKLSLSVQLFMCAHVVKLLLCLRGEFSLSLSWRGGTEPPVYKIGGGVL